MLLRQGGLPHIQPPSLFRPKIDGHVTRSIQIDLEPGAMKDDAVGNVANEVFGERVLFSQSGRLAKGELIDKICPDMMPVMNGGPD